MKIREAISNWKNNPKMAILAIETLKQKGLKPKRLRDFFNKYGNITKDDLDDLFNKSG